MPTIIKHEPVEQELVSRFNTLDQWLRWQETLHFSEIDLGLDRCGMVAEKMDLIDVPYLVITIAGTNGKGSCARMLESILIKNGIKAGCYTSPHLVNYNERIRVDGTEIEDGQICEAFSKIDYHRETTSLTYFEFGTLAALEIFNNSQIDVAILEVGLGGRLDAVNLLDADYVLLTSIDLDHHEWLGDTREAIGFEKAGVFRSSSQIVCADSNPPDSVTAHARKLEASIYISKRDFNYQIDNNFWNWQSGEQSREDLPVPSSYNQCQIENAAAVVKLVELLSLRIPIMEQAIFDGLADFSLKGRFQLIQRCPDIILDVAHNSESIDNLLASLMAMPEAACNHLVIGMMQDKVSTDIINRLSQYVDFWYVIDLNSDRAITTKDMVAILLETGLDEKNIFSGTMTDMLEQVKTRANETDRVIVTGSFITVSEALINFETMGV